jgi:hypothetical protein
MRLLFLILLVITPLSAMARQEAASRTCRVLFLARPADAPKNLFLFDGSASQEVELGSMSFSPVYQLPPGDITLALLSQPPAPAAGNNRPPVIPSGAPKAAVKEAIADFYLIVSSDPANTVAPVRMQVINANAGSFKTGQMMWFNLTESLVGGIVGSNKLRIQPNSREILDAPANGPEDYPVNIHFLPPGKQLTEPLCETRWIHDPRSRSVFFVYNEPGRIVPRIIGIPDFRSKPAG